MTAYCKVGTRGAELIAGIRQPDEPIVVKQHYSAFSNERFGAVVSGADVLIACGIAVDCCVLHTVFDATTRHGLDVYVPYDGVSASTTAAYGSALEIIAKSLGGIIDVESICQEVPDQWWAKAEELHASHEKPLQWYGSSCRKLAALSDNLGDAGDIRLLIRAVEDRLAEGPA